MKNDLTDVISRKVFYPAWDVWDRSVKLAELRELERAQWEPETTRRMRQRNRLREIVSHAAAHSPWYRGQGLERFTTLDDFRRWPILRKEHVRANVDRMIVDGQSRLSLVQAKTGGSTGVSLEVFFDDLCQQKRNAATLRSDRWSGWQLGEPKGALWGNPPATMTFRQRFRNRWLERLIFMDTVNMNERDMRRFVQEMRRRNIRTLYGHSHSLFIFANYVKTLGDEGIRLRSIISTSMSLLAPERAVIESVFGCPVSDRYGCEEVGVIASECERHDGLHINTDHLFVEFLRPDGSPAEPGEEAEIVITDLINRGMPMIRYAVGDVGIYTERRCGCGRTMPLLERVIGRTADFLVRRDGSLVAGVSLVERTLTAIPGIAQLQIVQEDVDGIDLNLVPDERRTDDTDRRLIAEFRRVFGDIRIDIHTVPRLDQTKNGKYRFSICKVGSRYQRAAREAAV